LSKSPSSSISRPAVKGDRLELRPAGHCMFSSERASARNTCAFRPAQPEQRPSPGLTVVVDLRRAALPAPLAVAAVEWRFI
jgi:hypothetical protein